MIFTVRRLKNGLLNKSNIEPFFGAIATAQETVDRCSRMIEMRNKFTRQIAEFFTNEPRTNKSTHGLEKTSRMYRWPNRTNECGFSKY